MRTGIVAGSLLLALSAHASVAVAQKTLNEREPATRDGTVKITSAVGSVHVRGTMGDSVVVSGQLGDDAARLEFTSQGRETRIRVVPPPEERPRAETRLEVQVPRGSHVAVRTVTADIRLDEVEGAVDLESISGDISVRGYPRMIYAETAGGDVVIDATTKVLRASSLNGDVTVTGARGYVEVSTVAGRARVTGGNVWEGEITSVSGDIVFEGSFDPAGSFYFESHSGDIDLVVPPTARIDFDLTTILSSRVTNDFAAPSARTFSIGGGGTRVRVKSFKGRIHIREGSPTGDGP